MNFEKLVEDVLTEDMVGGGDGGVFGPGVGGNSGGQFSSDSYATSDQRTPAAIFPGFITRNGSVYSHGKKRGKPKAKRSKRRSSKRSKRRSSK